MLREVDMRKSGTTKAMKIKETDSVASRSTAASSGGARFVPSAGDSRLVSPGHIHPHHEIIECKVPICAVKDDEPKVVDLRAEQKIRCCFGALSLWRVGQFARPSSHMFCHCRDVTEETNFRTPNTY
eukprot:1595482-Amphidinium_carterae.1